MKKLILSIIALIAGLIWSFYVGAIYQGSKIDLPEEINAISTNPSKPDTLIGYKEDNILHIGFKNYTQ